MPNGQRISFEQIEAIWNSAKTRMTKVVAYGVEDSELVIDLFDLLHTWIGLVELSSIVGVTITELFTRGQQIRCQSQIYDTAMKNGFVLNKRIAEKLFVSGGFVGEPIPGLFTRILCFDFSSLYPSIIRAYNICFTTFVTGYSDAEVTDDMCNVIEFDQEEDPKFKGGLDTGKESEGASDFVAKEDDDDEDETKVKKTVTKHYRFRFLKEEYRKGLLPTILSNLIGERKAVKAQIKLLEGQLKQFELILVAIKSGLDSKIKGEEVDELQQRFATQLDKYDGSSIDGHREDLGWSLTKIRQVIEDIDTELIILNERQGSLKVSANSLYGFLGVQNGGMMPLIEAAMAVTAIGRTLINKVNIYLEEKYGAEVKYNDTDSSMVDMHLEKDTDCHPWGIRIAQEISGIPEQRAPDGTLLRARVPGLFPPPLEVEYEKGMTVLLIKKKKYAYLSIGKDGNYLRNPDTGDLIISVKGIVPARRDNFAFLRETYMRMLSDILLFKPIDVGFGHIIDCVNMMFKGELRPRGNLTVIKQLGSDYKAENYFMKVFSDELARIGKPAAPGERLEYVVVRTRAEIENGEVVKLGLKMRDIDMWEDSWKFKHGSTPMVEDKKEQADLVALPEVFASILGIKTEKNDAPVYDADEIDYLYYVEHFLMNSLDQLFSVGYGKELAKYSGIGYSPAYSRCHYCSVQTPIKMIVKLINDFNKGGEDYLPVLAGLKQWFVDSRHKVDLMPDDDDDAAAEPSPVKKFRLKTAEPSPVKKFRLKTAEPSPVKKFRLKTAEPSPVKKFRLKTAEPSTEA
jgi:DNA polymerase elongation subunit (family B)